jgi:ketosteroid isomerase-like protein
MFIRFAISTILALVLAAATPPAQAKSLNSAALTAWLAAYGAAWQTRDPAAAGKLFTADATYHEMPFDAPKAGRAAIEDYWRGVTADQRDVVFRSEVISTQGKTGVAHWSAKFKVASTGATIELDGVFVLEFDATGACSGLREWWHVRAGS